MEFPLVSVIIPAYNAGEFIGQAVGSVRGQDYPNIEIIVVNDGSTDNTGAVLSSIPGITVLSQPNRGQAAAKNAGLRAANGKYIGFLDADDYWTGTHAIDLMKHLMPGSPYGFARGLVRCVQDMGGLAREVGADTLFEGVIGACLYSRATIEAVGFFDESMRAGEDFDWVFRLRETGIPGKQVNKAVLLYRRHGGNMTDDRQKVALGQLRSLRKHVQRMEGSAK